MKPSRSIAAFLCLTVAFCTTAMAQDAKPKQSFLITNARVFDGQNEKLADGMSVLVEGNVDLAKVDLSEDAPLMKLDVMGPVDLAGDVSTKFTPGGGVQVPDAIISPYRKRK